MKNNKLNYKLINITAFMLLLYITVSNVGTWYDILGRLINITLPFIIAFALAYALTPAVKWLVRNGIPKWLAITFVAFSMVLIVFAIVVLTLPMIYDQLVSLSSNVGVLADSIGEKFNLNLGDVEGIVDSNINKIIANLGSVVTKGSSAIISKSIGVLGNVIVGFVASIYFLSYMDNIRSSVRNFLLKTSKKSFNYVKSLDEELGNYIKGLAIFMVIQLFEYSILFRLVNHPNWLILGILACITTVIPYFGGLITNIIALILASITTPYTFFGTLIICAIFPQLDGYFISPKVYGKTNNVNPLITIMAVSVGGTIAGAWGIIAALPIYLFIRATIVFFKKDLKKQVKNLKESI